MINEIVQKWIKKALEDFRVIENELTFPEKKLVTSMICFHCQQFIEKSLKGYLSYKNIDFGKTHDLEVLLKTCVKEDKDFSDLDIKDLTFYAVEVRYTDEFYVPTVTEAKESYEVAKKVKKLVFEKLSIKNEKDLK